MAAWGWYLAAWIVRRNLAAWIVRRILAAWIVRRNLAAWIYIAFLRLFPTWCSRLRLFLNWCSRLWFFLTWCSRLTVQFLGTLWKMYVGGWRTFWGQRIFLQFTNILRRSWLALHCILSKKSFGLFRDLNFEPGLNRFRRRLCSLPTEQYSTQKFR